MIITLKHPRSDAEQVKSEQHSEQYIITVKRVAQFLPQLYAESKHRVFCSAKKQVFAVGGF
jgi:hypothetical protein